MIRPPLTKEEIKCLQEISNNLAGLQTVLSEYKLKVDSIINKYTNPRGAKSKAALLRKAKKLESDAHILSYSIKSREKRYDDYKAADKDRAEQALLLAEAKRLREEAAKLI